MTDDQVAEYAQKRAESKENFIACYLAETGLKVSEVMLVEKRSDDGLRIEWYCEPRQAVFRFIHPKGTIEQVRTWPGETRYTGNFTPPTESV